MTLDDLYDAFEPGLRRYARSLAGDADDADDLVQETFVRSLGHLPLLEQLDTPQRRAWLFQTLRRLFLESRATRARRQQLLHRFRAELEQVPQPSDPMVSVELAQIMVELSEETQQLLHKRYGLGMTSRELGAELDLPAATVRFRLHATLKRLRTHLATFGPPPGTSRPDPPDHPEEPK